MEMFDRGFLIIFNFTLLTKKAVWGDTLGFFISYLESTLFTSMFQKRTYSNSEVCA